MQAKADIDQLYFLSHTTSSSGALILTNAVGSLLNEKFTTTLYSWRVIDCITVVTYAKHVQQNGWDSQHAIKKRALT